MRYILSLILIMTISFDRANAETLSNLMPVELVKQLHDNHLWDAGWDDNYGANAADMLEFWKTLTSRQINIDAVFKTLTSASDNKSQVFFPRLYPTKIYILRYLRRVNPQTYETVFQAWMRQYLETALTLIDPSNSTIADYGPIVSAFQNLLRSGNLTLLDLSPDQRRTFDIESMPHHGSSKLEEKDANGQYLIFGRYNFENKILAVDFGQDLYKTLVTIAHEIVHASDPIIYKHIADFQNAIPNVARILSRWIGNSQVTLPLIERVFSQILFEKNPNSFFVRDSFNPNQFRIENLKKILNIETGVTQLTFTPSDIEKKILENFFKSYIGITIENEYRAYGLSWTLFLVPQYRYLLAKPNSQEQDFLKEIIEGGDGLLLRRLQLMLDPFPDLRLNYPKQLEEFVKHNPKEQQYQLKIVVGRAINFLDLIYTNTLEGILKEHSQKFSNLFTSLKQRQKERPDLDNIMPFYAGSADAFNSPFNPYQILTARLTTAHIIQFHVNIREVLQNLKSTNLSLLLTQMGIYDFHNMTVGEQRLIGLLYSKCTTSRLNSDFSTLAADLRRDLDFVESEIIEKFDLVECPAVTGYLADVVNYEVLRTNFLRLKLARVYYWLERSFPIFDASLKSLRRYHDLLYRGEGFSKDEISEEKAAQMREEIIKAFELSQFSRDELNRYQILNQYLATYMDMAKEANWRSLYDNVGRKVNEIQEILEIQKIYESKTYKEMDNDIISSALSLKAQLMPYQLKCQKDCERDKKPPHMVCRPTMPIENLTALGEKFSINSACMNNKLYLMRQPGDTLKPFTVLSYTPTQNDPRALTQMGFNGISRKFELMPFGISDNILFDKKVQQQETKPGFFKKVFRW